MKKQWYNVKKADNNTADVYLYNEIGFYGITASQFITDIVALGNVKTLNVHINSIGGDVFDGIAIYNTLLQHNARVNIIIEGVAASIASVIAMAGDKVSMYETALFMVHKPWTFAAGDSKDLEKTAEILDKLQEAIVAAYLSKAKDLSESDINELVDEESWMLAAEAKEKGFVDKIIKRDADEKKTDEDDIEARIVDCRDLIAEFKNVPQRITAMVTSLPPKAAAPVPEPNPLETENKLLKDELLITRNTILILSKI